MIEVINNTTVSLLANAQIPFTTNTFDTNNRMYFDASNNSIVITKVGKYEINGSFIYSPTSSGIVSITAYANGVAIPCDICSFTSTADSTYTFTLPQKIINVIQATSGNVVAITFTVNLDGTLTNAVASVKYVE